MCKRLILERQHEAVGSFQKGNEPYPMKMSVIAAPCECGMWYTRVPNGKLWIDAKLVQNAAA